MRSIVVPVLLLAVNSVFSQTNSNVNQEFTTLSKYGLGGTSAIQSFKSTQIDGNQFFLPDWKRGEVTTSNKESFRKNLLFLYDKVRQELFIREKDSSLVLLGNKPDIISFILMDDGKEYHFINSSNYSPAAAQVYYQVLVNNPPKLSLLKLTSATLVKSDPTDMIAQRDGQVNDAFVDKYTYYLAKANGDPIAVPLKMKSLKAALAEEHINADKYLSGHSGKLDEDYLVAMVNSLNTEN